MASKSVEVIAWVAVLGALIVGLSKGADIFIPLTVALMIWYLLNAFAMVLKRKLPGGDHLPELLCVAIAMLVVMGALLGTFDLLIISLSGISTALPRYQENLNGTLRGLAGYFGMETAPGIDEVIAKIDLKWAVGSVGLMAKELAGDMGLILVYILFLIFEQESFTKKMRVLIPEQGRRASMSRVVQKIQAGIREYVLIKTLMCVLVGMLTFVVLKVLGVDYAFFWAFVAFLSNFVPTVGSLVGITLPTLFALVQFPSPATSLTVLAALGSIHFGVGNLLEPKLMSGKLNISAFVVILSLVVWGKLWGIMGMFLCVPLTVIAMIILAHFPGTRPIALLLSEDGDLKLGDED